jgi:hypothetical protein
MFEGSCHCGAIRFRVNAVISELTTCDCSLCVKRNAVMAKIPEHALTVVKGEELLTLYQVINECIGSAYQGGGNWTCHRNRCRPRTLLRWCGSKTLAIQLCELQ